MKRALIVLIMLILASSCKSPAPAPLNASIVLLRGNDHACTGFQALAPSGKVYLLTAGHCSALEDERGYITAVTNDGAYVQTRAISLDPAADILLLEALPNLPSLPIAEETHYGEAMRIVGHGYGLGIWEVDGHIIGDINMLDWIETAMSGGAAPGHSGSPVLDPDGHVCGVLSVSNGVISGFARLADLKDFLKGY
jgi:hypothetical protein